VTRLNTAGLEVVIVTNQSGIAQGFITPEEYAAVERRVAERFEEMGARIDGTYHCPHHPSVDGPCECRKPGTLLHRRAAEERRLDLRASWAVGDRLSDLEPLRALGGRAILVRTGTGADHEDRAAAEGYPVADDLGAAVDQILGRRSPPDSP
jgi:D-glycero-D-manno-heptose 1,7-bisphosphate phosphatase